MRFLLHGVYWVSGEGEVLGPGYIYIKDGVVEVVEPGEPPEERQFAELVAGGEGRLVLPGLALGPVVPETYPLRWLFPPWEAAGLLRGSHPAARAIASMSGEEAYHAARMLLYEAALEGYSYAVLVTPHVEAAARALQEAGLAGLVLYPRGCGALDTGREPPSSVPGVDSSRIRVSVLSCSGGEAEAVLREDGLVELGGVILEPPPWRGRGVPAAVVASAMSPWPLLSGMAHPKPLEAYRGLAALLPQALAGHGPLEGPASLAVLDLTEPPGWSPVPPPPTGLGPSRPRVEMLLSQGRLVVDGGEHLYLGSRAAEEASAALRGLAEKLAAGGRA